MLRSMGRSSQPAVSTRLPFLYRTAAVNLIKLDTHTGLTVTERNYLEVFPYDKWSDKELPRFEQGETFTPSVCELKEGQTSRPSLLTEADLVSLMDKNGIGTSSRWFPIIVMRPS